MDLVLILACTRSGPPCLPHLVLVPMFRHHLHSRTRPPNISTMSLSVLSVMSFSPWWFMSPQFAIFEIVFASKVSSRMHLRDLSALISHGVDCNFFQLFGPSRCLALLSAMTHCSCGCVSDKLQTGGGSRRPLFGRQLPTFCHSRSLPSTSSLMASPCPTQSTQIPLLPVVLGHACCSWW